jgi:hypothetical protein
MDWIQLTQGPVEGSCEHGNEFLVSIKRERFPDQPSSYQLLKKNFAPWS